MRPSTTCWEIRKILKKGRLRRRTASVKELNHEKLEKLEKGLRVFFNASQCARAKGAGNTLSLVPSRSLAQWKTLLRKFFPKHADGTLPLYKV